MAVPVPIATSGIAAEAFQIVELGPISSFADDTPEAADATAYYTSALETCLEWADWDFASTLVTLPPAELPAGLAVDVDLPYTYALPGDCLMLREVRDFEVSYRNDDQVLRADQDGGLKIRYTRRMDNEGRLPATFRSAVSLALALKLGPRWLGTQTKIALIENRLQSTLERAARHSARTASPTRYDDGPDNVDWVAEALR